MKHVGTIEALLETLIKSEVFHALVVQSPPGWSKSTTINGALLRLKQPFIAMGSYTTPLHFYNTLAENPRAIIVLDDCAGLFNDAKTMSILKSATWSGSGSGSSRARRIAWGSTSDKVVAPSAEFDGKVILLTNSLPLSKEVQAFLSRCLNYRISFSEREIKKMLQLAADSAEYFDDRALSKEVADFIVERGGVDFSQINLRSLRLGYELAKTQPQIWRELLPHLLPKPEASRPSPLKIETDPSLPIKAQAAEFQARTGKSRRTFYNYRKKLGLTRPYRSYEPEPAKQDSTEQNEET